MEESGPLGATVETVDGVVAVGHYRHGLTPRRRGPPRLDDLFLHFGAGAAVEAAVPFVCFDGLRVAGAELEAGLAFPLVAEAVHLVQGDGAVTVDEVGEHAASYDGGELVGVTDQDHPPVLPVGEVGESGEDGGGCARLIHDDRRPPWQVELLEGCAV